MPTWRSWAMCTRTTWPGCICCAASRCMCTTPTWPRRRAGAGCAATTATPAGARCRCARQIDVDFHYAPRPDAQGLCRRRGVGSGWRARARLALSGPHRGPLRAAGRAAGHRLHRRHRPVGLRPVLRRCHLGLADSVAAWPGCPICRRRPGSPRTTVAWSLTARPSCGVAAFAARIDERESRLLQMLADGPRTLASWCSQRLLYPPEATRCGWTAPRQRTIVPAPGRIVRRRPRCGTATLATGWRGTDLALPIARHLHAKRIRQPRCRRRAVQHQAADVRQHGLHHGHDGLCCRGRAGVARAGSAALAGGRQRHRQRCPVDGAGTRLGRRQRPAWPPADAAAGRGRGVRVVPGDVPGHRCLAAHAAFGAAGLPGAGLDAQRCRRLLCRHSCCKPGADRRPRAGPAARGGDGGLRLGQRRGPGARSRRGGLAGAVQPERAVVRHGAAAAAGVGRVVARAAGRSAACGDRRRTAALRRCAPAPTMAVAFVAMFGVGIAQITVGFYALDRLGLDAPPPHAWPASP